MISTLLRVSRLSLSRDRVAQTMTFVLPIAFFSIFALVFGRPSFTSTSAIPVAVVDDDHSKMSRALVAALKTDAGLQVRDSAAVARGANAPRIPIDRARAERMVRTGDLSIAVILPAGWGATFPNLTGQGMAADVLADPSDPVAKQIVIGLLQRSAAKVIRGGMEASGIVDAPASEPDGASGSGGGGGSVTAAAPAADPFMLVPAHVADVVGERKSGSGRMISFYAAGIAVMFLLFSCSAGAGVLLDEVDSGTLERVLNTRVGMTGLLAGKWLHLTSLGLMQITVMFLWGALVFHLDLAHHLPGFAIMTLATAAAAAAFGLVLATLCRTRQQLSGISTLVILVMSAMGGSMFPRFLMSEAMQKIGLVTFNAWALDGYIKVFWRELPLIELWPQLAVLVSLTAAFLLAARLMARRWETA